MRSYIALFILLVLTLPAFGQNFSVELIPLSGLVLPDTGGIFGYQVTVTNQEAVPRSADVWGTVTRPNGTTQPVPGQTTQTFLGNQAMTWQRQETLPPRAPVGYYTLRAYVGLYPNTIWAQAECQFQKQVLTGGVEQEWVARYNGPGNYEDFASSIATDGVGNIYVTGYSYGSGTNKDIATIKYNAFGVAQWVARYNGPGNYQDGAYSLVIGGNENIYVAGCTYSGSVTAFDYVTIKYDTTGQQQWSARYNGPGNWDDGVRCLAVDDDGNVYVTGVSNGIGTSEDYATIKYNSAGEEQWVMRYNGPSNDEDIVSSLAVDEDGNVYVTGYSYGAHRDFATIKYTSSGIEQWVARYNGLGNGHDGAASLVVDHDGNVIVTGYSMRTETDNDYTTIKYNANGVQQWVAFYNGPDDWDDRANSIALDSDGNVIVTGFSAGNGTWYDYATVKYNQNGVEQWVARYNDPNNHEDEAFGITVDASSNVYVTGYSYYSGVSADYTTIKYNSNGIQQWIAGYNGPANLYDRIYDVAVDENVNVYVTGGIYTAANNSDYTTIKYSQPAIPNWQEVTAVPFGAPLPEETCLLPPSPNPFNQMTDVRYQMADNRHVSLKVYDIAGRLVSTMVNGRRQAGSHEVTLDGSSLSSGVYFVRMQAGDFMGVQKIILLK